MRNEINGENIQWLQEALGQDENRDPLRDARKSVNSQKMNLPTISFSTFDTEHHSFHSLFSEHNNKKYDYLESVVSEIHTPGILSTNIHQSFE